MSLNSVKLYRHANLKEYLAYEVTIHYNVKCWGRIDKITVRTGPRIVSQIVIF